MKLNIVSKLLSTPIGRKVYKHRSSIEFGVGLACVIGASIAIGVQARKLDEEIEEPVEELKAIKKKKASDPDGYSEKEYTTDLMKGYGNVCVKAGKLFAVPAAVELAGVFLLTKSHTTLLKENAGLAVGYMAFDRAYKKLVDNVKKNTDEETYDKIVRGITTVDKEIDVVDEDGNSHVETERIEVVNEAGVSNPYAVFFDASSAEWEDSPEYNKSFLLSIQDKFNRKLRRERVVFWNEILEAIGLPRTVTGQYVGWYYDENNPVGDNIISLGLDNAHSRQVRAFMNGFDPVVLIEPNIAGRVIDYL